MLGLSQLDVKCVVIFINLIDYHQVKLKNIERSLKFSLKIAFFCNDEID